MPDLNSPDGLTVDDVPALVEQRRQQIRDLPDDVRLALIQAERANRRAYARRSREIARANARKRKKERRRVAARPTHGVYGAISSGAYKPKRPPRATLEDRAYVPGVVRHWRITHDLSHRQAQARVGLSANSCSWRHWEGGITVPSYRMLLRVIAATGLGTLMERRDAPRVSPDLLLEGNRADYLAAVRARRRRRQSSAR